MLLCIDILCAFVSYVALREIGSRGNKQKFYKV